MDHMGPNIVVDVVDYSIITVKSCKSSSQITPFLFDEHRTKQLAIKIRCQSTKLAC
jgi:hypothetical protein